MHIRCGIGGIKLLNANQARAEIDYNKRYASSLRVRHVVVRLVADHNGATRNEAVRKM
jgi:hypothetical protein